jgi:hypothetical protein
MRLILAIVGLHIDPHLCAMLGLVLTSMTGTMGLLLLLGSGRPGQFLKTLEQRIAAAGGLFGLSFAGCSLFWRFYGSLIHSRALAISLYVGWKILGGMFLAMLVCILAPRNIRALISASIVVLIGFNLVVVFGYSTGRLTASLIFPALGIGLLIGMSVHCSIFLSREKPGKASLSQRKNEDASVVVIPGGA